MKLSITQNAAKELGIPIIQPRSNAHRKLWCFTLQVARAAIVVLSRPPSLRPVKNADNLLKWVRFALHKYNNKWYWYPGKISLFKLCQDPYQVIYWDPVENKHPFKEIFSQARDARKTHVWDLSHPDRLDREFDISKITQLGSVTLPNIKHTEDVIDRLVMRLAWVYYKTDHKQLRQFARSTVAYQWRRFNLDTKHDICRIEDEVSALVAVMVDEQLTKMPYFLRQNDDILAGDHRANLLERVTNRLLRGRRYEL